MNTTSIHKALFKVVPLLYGHPVGYFGVADVKLHTNAHSCLLNQNNPLYIRNKISKVQISENFGT